MFNRIKKNIGCVIGKEKEKKRKKSLLSKKKNKKIKHIFCFKPF